MFTGRLSLSRWKPPNADGLALSDEPTNIVVGRLNDRIRSSQNLSEILNPKSRGFGAVAMTPW
jgi:hypothetical protein